MSTEEPRRRIVIKKAGHQAHHGGAWKVAYADFVTTMMALFIVLWLVGQNDQVRQAVAQYFRHPSVLPSGSANPMPAGAGILPGERRDAATAAAAVTSTDDSTEEAVLKAAAEKIQKAIEDNPNMSEIRDQIDVHVTPEGLRIELIERDNSTFFRVGSAIPTRPLTPLLDSLQKILGTLPNHITIEGHTDARQYARRDYSNWELSTDRANVARRILETQGLPAGQIDRIAGYADRLLRVPDDPLSASNRRISLLVRRQHKDAQAPAASEPMPAVPGARPLAPPRAPLS